LTFAFLKKHEQTAVQTGCPEHLVRMRSAVRIRPAAPKSIENFGFRCFFVAKTTEMVWVKMWVNCLTHTVTHTTKCVERLKEYRREGKSLLSGIFAFFLLT